MRRLSVLAALPLIFFCFIGNTRASQDSLTGEWTGGVQIKDKWLVTQAQFEKEQDGVKGSLNISDVWFVNERGLKVEHLSLEPARVRFQVKTAMGVFDFGGQFRGEELAGDVQTPRGRARSGSYASPPSLLKSTTSTPATIA